MTPAEAAAVLGVAPGVTGEDLRRAYRTQIRTHHPDRPEGGSQARATVIIEAYRILSDQPADGPEPAPPRAAQVQRVGADTVLVAAPADETFRWLADAANDVGEITYVDRSMPIMEVLCRFDGEPATSLLLTLQGRGAGTEVFCTVESIEARPAPPTAAVVDLLELALHRRRDGGAQFSSSS